MKTFRFRDFEVYKEAKTFRKLCREFLKKIPDQERYRLIDQIERALQSVILNIAEGSAKKSDKELAQFLERSICSVNEVVAGFDTAFDDKIITEDDLKVIEEAAEILAKRIGAFIKKLDRS